MTPLRNIGPRGEHFRRACFLFSDFAFAAGVSAFTGDLRRIFMAFAVGAAVLIVGHTRTSGVGAFLLVSHAMISPSKLSILDVGCKFEAIIWQDALP